MSVTRRERNGWQYVDISYGGTRKVVALHTKDAKVAERVRRKIEADITLGRFDMKDLHKKEATLQEFTTEYVEYARSYKKPLTVENDARFLKTFGAVVGNNTSLRRIDAQAVDRWKMVVLKDGYSPTTFNIMWRTLHAAFSVAIKWGYLDRNPIGYTTKLKPDLPRQYITEFEIKRIFDAIDADIHNPNKRHHHPMNQKYRLFVEFLLLTGLRKGEALGLTPDRIDTEKEVLYLEKTKGKTFRAVPMHPRVKKILKEAGELVFTDLESSTVSHKFSRYARKSGVGRAFKLHSLRHTFATNLVSKGVDISVVQSLLGHSDIRTTLVYSKTTLETLRNGVARLDTPADEKTTK